MTRPTAGVPHHPVVTRVEFQTTAGPDSIPAEKYSAQLMARTVGHLEKVDVGALISAHLEVVGEDFASLPPERQGEQLLVLMALVETVLDQARSTLRTRMAMDLATTLIPRLKGTRSL